MAMNQKYIITVYSEWLELISTETQSVKLPYFSNSLVQNENLLRTDDNAQLFFSGHVV